MKLLQTRTALTAIAVLLAGHLLLDLSQALIQPAMASNTIDCRIVDISTYDKLKVTIAGIDTNTQLNVKMDDWRTNSWDALKVKVIEWEESDPIAVKIRD